MSILVAPSILPNLISSTGVFRLLLTAVAKRKTGGSSIDHNKNNTNNNNNPNSTLPPTMNRQLRLDTGNTTANENENGNGNTASHAGLNRRYSILQTPLEMQPPTPDDPALRPLSATATATTTSHPGSTQNADADPDAANKEMRQTQPGASQPTDSHTPIAPPYIMPGSPPPPPPEQHPANFAPYADEMTLHRSTHRAPTGTNANPHTDNAIEPAPTSPGPLPIKHHPTITTDQAQNTNTNTNSQSLPVEPDTNPLQSPLFPPATAISASQQTPVAGEEDITPFHQPGQVRHPNQAIKGGNWSNHLCDCSNISSCCLGIFCPCILYGKTQYRLGLKSRKEDPTNMLGFDPCNGSCTAMALLCGCQCMSLLSFTPLSLSISSVHILCPYPLQNK